MIIRIQKNEPFGMVPKRMLADKRLSWRAKGILCYLLSKPNDWIVKRGDVISQSTEGRDAVQAAFKELRAVGYAWMKNTKEGTEWIISGQPTEKPLTEKPLARTNGKAGNGKSVPVLRMKGTKNDPPIVPQGGRRGRTDTKEAAEWADRIAKIFHRRLDTPWLAKEIKAFKAALPFHDDDLCMVERRYAAEWPPREGNTLRRDLCTFLNNYRGEVDRALAWCEKHPVRSKTLRAKPVEALHSEAPPPDPAAQAKFLEDFRAKFGRLPYGHNDNGHEKADS